MHREPRVPPREHPLGQEVRDQALAAQQIENAFAKRGLEQLARNGRQDAEAAIGIESAVRGEHVYMRVEVDQVAEGLHEEDDARPRTGSGAGVEAGEQALDDVAQLAQEKARMQACRQWSQ